VTIESRRLRLRPTREGDRARLEQILSAPAVRRWWGEPGPKVEDAIAPGEETDSYAIELRGGGGDRGRGGDGGGDGAVIGVIQSWSEEEPDFRHAGIDVALAPEVHGRGYGGEAVAALARHLFEHRRHHRVTIDPAAANVPAIRAYERIGFKPVGVMRRYWRDPDGVWQDGLLMDLLPEELVEP